MSYGFAKTVGMFSQKKQVLPISCNGLNVKKQALMLFN